MLFEEMTFSEWEREGERRFGVDRADWRFVCPTCGHVASVAQYRAAGAPDGSIGFSCIGRWLEGSRGAFDGFGIGPCDYAGGGLVQLNPILVTWPDNKRGFFFTFAPADGAWIIERAS